jgi:hypothetical protein
MAYSGPPGKGMKHGRTPTSDWTDVLDVVYGGPSPDLPKLGRNKKWAPMVEEWWQEVRVMPHCVLWTPTDWRFAIETAYLKAALWNDLVAGELKSTLATEVRRREDQIGTTGEARRRLRIRYIDPGDVAGPNAAPGSDLAVAGQDSDADAEAADELAARRRRVAGA